MHRVALQLSLRTSGGSLRQLCQAQRDAHLPKNQQAADHPAHAKPTLRTSPTMGPAEEGPDQRLSRLEDDSVSLSSKSAHKVAATQRQGLGG